MKNKEDIVEAIAAFVDIVERYVEPKPGQKYVLRTELLLKKKELKRLLGE